MTLEIGPWSPAPRPTPRGGAIFAIGDVHGHASHLAAMHEAIAARIAEAYAPETVTLAWLGDYVDRGRAPLQTLDLVAQGLGVAGLDEIRIRGNHDAYLQAAARGDMDERDLDLWRMNGAETTIEGVIGHPFTGDAGDLSGLLAEALGPDRLEFLDRLSLHERRGDWLFAHAGVHPTTPLESQSEETFLWIREPFLEARRWIHDFAVLHGHSPHGYRIRDHRIGVDSGVYFSGVLSACEIAGDKVRPLHVVAP